MVTGILWWILISELMREQQQQASKQSINWKERLWKFAQQFSISLIPGANRYWGEYYNSTIQQASVKIENCIQMIIEGMKDQLWNANFLIGPFKAWNIEMRQMREMKIILQSPEKFKFKFSSTHK
jgi:hypothetical protein